MDYYKTNAERLRFILKKLWKIETSKILCHRPLIQLPVRYSEIEGWAMQSAVHSCWQKGEVGIEGPLNYQKRDGPREAVFESWKWGALRSITIYLAGCNSTSVRMWLRMWIWMALCTITGFHLAEQEHQRLRLEHRLSWIRRDPRRPRRGDWGRVLWHSSSATACQLSLSIGPEASVDSVTKPPICMMPSLRVSSSSSK